jgi:hypothetical protein
MSKVLTQKCLNFLLNEAVSEACEKQNRRKTEWWPQPTSKAKFKSLRILL